jgi:enamine deaminase RidA (YjgF/YER057c/UK114 family)
MRYFSILLAAASLVLVAGCQAPALPSGGIGPETRQTLENIKNTVEKHGSSMDRVFKCTVMLADISEWAAMNEVYVTFFPGNKPARSAFGASGLAMGARVEIECLATLP